LTRFITLEDYGDDTSNTIVDSINISSNISVVSTKFEWTWKIHRVQPNTGGILQGTAEDCASLISFEWLDTSQPLHDTTPYKLDQIEAMEFRHEYEMLYECTQQFGTSGYYINTSGNQRSRPENGGLGRFYFVRVDGNNKIENTSQQFKLCPIESLPRDDAMSSPPKRMWPRVDLDNEGTEENWVISTFNRVVVEGSFVVEWSDHINNNNGEKELKYSIYVDSLGPKKSPLRKSYALVSFIYGQESEEVINNSDNPAFLGKDTFSSGGSFGVSKGGKDHPFMKFFTENQSHYFCARLWHWVLRQRNVMSLMKHTGTQMALTALLVLYVNNKSRKDALNVAIMYADYSYQIKDELADGNERMYHASLKVGNLLEALDRFSVAAEIYAEIGDTFLSMSSDPYFFAGRASKQTGNFKEAERHFVKALHYNRIAINPNSKPQAFLFEELVEIYYITNKEERDHQVVIGALLPTLLCVAGFDSYQGKEMPLIKKIGAYNGILKKKFESRSASRNVLEKAMQFSTVEDFRDVLLACKNPKADLHRAVKDHSMDDSYFAERRKRNKKIAKQVLGAGCVVVPPDQICDHCNTLMYSPKQCPCEAALYCSKSCQVSHWKSHKQVCPLRAKKTDSK
jgi:tetratricopeptide (TPR) repeat protein